MARAAERQKTSPEEATSGDGIKRAGAVSKVHSLSPSPLWSRDWGKVFPYVPMAVLASTAAEAQWALELCADRFADPADAHDRFFRRFVRVMCELGEETCLASRNIYEFVTSHESFRAGTPAERENQTQVASNEEHLESSTGA